jgi:hypothetical protein
MHKPFLKALFAMLCLMMINSCSPSKAFPQGSTTNYAVDSDPYVWSYATAEEVNAYRTTEYLNQWGLEAIHAAEAYAALAKNGKAVAGDGVMVAITDSGARTTHQDIAGNINNSLNRNFNVTPSTNNVDDTNGHGTHTMTTAVGVKNNSGIHGVAFNADTFAVKMIGFSTENGIEYAALRGAKVVSMSWESDYDIASDLAELTVGKNHDVLMVAAAGNDGAATPIFPAMFANNPSLAGYVLAVGAVQQDGFGSYVSASFSNQCGPTKEYCLVAPGVGITAGYIGSDTSYASLSGTSMATPHVSGAAAVIRGAWNFLSAVQVSEILLETADDLGAPGVDDVYGHGMLNLFAAVQAQGSNNFNFGVRVSDGGYDLRSSSMLTSPIFGDAIQSNVLPKLSSAVFFDKYGRDYKANLASKVGMNHANNSPNLNSIILNNISYQALPLNLGFDGKTNLKFNVSGYKNPEAKNAVGLKYALVDNSIDQQQQASSNNGFSFTQKDVILPNSNFGFAFNVDEISNSQYKSFGGFGFMMANNLPPILIKVSYSKISDKILKVAENLTSFLSDKIS